MKAFWKRHQKLHLWLLADLCLIAAFFLPFPPGFPEVGDPCP